VAEGIRMLSGEVWKGNPEIVVSLAQAYDNVIGGAVDLNPVVSDFRQRVTAAQLECHVIVGDLTTGTGIDLFLCRIRVPMLGSPRVIRVEGRTARIGGRPIKLNRSFSRSDVGDRHIVLRRPRAQPRSRIGSA
jgi:hypothetical protein